MAEKFQASGPSSWQGSGRDYLNAAFRSGAVARIAKAIGTTAKVHDLFEVAKKTKLTRSMVYRAFSGEGAFPNRTHVVPVLEAMGLELRIKQIKKRGAKTSQLSRGQLD